MTSEQLAKVLQDELTKRDWNVTDLARSARMNRETVRRAVHGIGSTSLDVANRLLATLDRRMSAEVSA